MPRYTINLYAVLVLLLVSCSNQPQKNEIIILNEAQELAKLVSEDVQIVDVRTASEYAAGHIANAQLITLQDEKFLKKMESLDKEQPLIVYCEVGGRSSRAIDKISNLGFKQIYNYKGGMQNWRGEDMPIEK
ncbi:MAG: rhodanese-like domain-containing protein [Cyclobacteriaceae bacterium]